MGRRPRPQRLQMIHPAHTIMSTTATMRTMLFSFVMVLLPSDAVRLREEGIVQRGLLLHKVEGTAWGWCCLSHSCDKCCNRAQIVRLLLRPRVSHLPDGTYTNLLLV